LEGEDLLENETKREMGNEKGKMVIQPTGTIVLEFLLKHFEKLFNYDYTKQMEDDLDLIAKGDKDWYELCNDCLREITELSKYLYNSENEEKKDTTIKIDKNHTYMIGRYGPVVKCISSDDKKTVTFKPVKPDLDIGKLKRGEYTLDEILSTETKTDTKELGKYNDNPIYLKNGKFGFYIEWRDIKKSIEPEVVDEMTLNAAIEILSKNESTNLTIVRKIDDHTSIRTGKFGDYIFHKKPTWKKPQFLKMNDFVKDNKTEDGKEMSYRTCDISILSNWVYTKFKL
jgi:DNA topoisomerase-1